MNDTQLVLLAAKTLISNPKDWLKKHEAKDKKGKSVLASNEQACKWCATGALIAVCQDAPKNYSGLFLYHAKKVTWLNWSYNDYYKSTHETVMKWFDRAIKLAGEKNPESLCWPGQKVLLKREPLVV